VHGALLVPDQDVLDLVLLEQLVVDVEDRAARVAEDVLDAFVLEAADDDFRAGELHMPALRWMSVFPRAKRARAGTFNDTGAGVGAFGRSGLG
jgi:hypothetical protein